jgi:hypothetical protein
MKISVKTHSFPFASGCTIQSWAVTAGAGKKSADVEMYSSFPMVVVSV